MSYRLSLTATKVDETLLDATTSCTANYSLGDVVLRFSNNRSDFFVTIGAATEQRAGLMTADMLNKLNSLSGNDVDKTTIPNGSTLVTSQTSVGFTFKNDNKNLFAIDIPSVSPFQAGVMTSQMYKEVYLNSVKVYDAIGTGIGSYTDGYPPSSFRGIGSLVYDASKNLLLLEANILGSLKCYTKWNSQSDPNGLDYTSYRSKNVFISSDGKLFAWGVSSFTNVGLASGGGGTAETEFLNLVWYKDCYTQQIRIHCDGIKSTDSVVLYRYIRQHTGDEICRDKYGTTKRVHTAGWLKASESAMLHCELVRNPYIAGEWIAKPVGYSTFVDYQDDVDAGSGNMISLKRKCGLAIVRNGKIISDFIKFRVVVKTSNGMNTLARW